MIYRLGAIIPKSEVLKRYKDEDGEFFLEVRGNDDVLFRVTTGDRVYYKIEKDKMVDEELTLVVDYTKVKQETTEIPEWEGANTPNRPKTVKGSDNLGLEFFEFPAPIGASAPRAPQQPEEITHLDEGQEVPEQLRYRCEANDYGGYTLRYNKFLYMLSSDYRVEIKSPDSDQSYDLTPDPEFSPGAAAAPGTPEPGEEPLNLIDESSKGPVEDIELEKGDLLPANLRPLCEAEIGANYGSRIIIGGYLYFLDSQYTVTQKMKIASVEEKKTGPVPVIQEQSEDKSISPQETETQKGPPVKIGLKSVIKSFLIALKKFGVSADYFKDSVFGAANRDTLLRAYMGDLSELNDDLNEAAARGKNVRLDKGECGFTFFKAVVLHELYINSTLSGRGSSMKYLVSYIIAYQPDDTLAPLDEELPREDQEALMDFFDQQAGNYDDKTETFRRVCRQIRQTIFDEYKELWLNKENVLFKGLVIVRFYEHTTRLDRGDGLSMIRLCRDLMGF